MWIIKSLSVDRKKEGSFDCCRLPPLPQEKEKSPLSAIILQILPTLKTQNSKLKTQHPLHFWLSHDIVLFELWQQIKKTVLLTCWILLQRSYTLTFRTGKKIIFGALNFKMRYNMKKIDKELIYDESFIITPILKNINWIISIWNPIISVDLNTLYLV